MDRMTLPVPSKNSVPYAALAVASFGRRGSTSLFAGEMAGIGSVGACLGDTKHSRDKGKQPLDKCQVLNRH
jgi:hypothetical protein